MPKSFPEKIKAALGIDTDYEEERQRKLRSQIYGIYNPTPVRKHEHAPRKSKTKKPKSQRRKPHLKYLEELRYLANQRLSGKCNFCSSSNHLTYDHIYPTSKGGCGCKGNIQILCENCNIRKADMIFYDLHNYHFGHTKHECTLK